MYIYNRRSCHGLYKRLDARYIFKISDAMKLLVRIVKKSPHTHHPVPHTAPAVVIIMSRLDDHRLIPGGQRELFSAVDSLR